MLFILLFSGPYIKLEWARITLELIALKLKVTPHFISYLECTPKENLLMTSSSLKISSTAKWTWPLMWLVHHQTTSLQVCPLLRRNRRKNKKREEKTQKLWPRDSREDIGIFNKIKGIIGSSNSTPITSSTSIWGGLIESSRLWKNLFNLEKLNNAEATIKRWRKSTAVSWKYSRNSELLIMAQQIPNLFSSTWPKTG